MFNKVWEMYRLLLKEICKNIRKIWINLEKLVKQSLNLDKEYLYVMEKILKNVGKSWHVKGISRNPNDCAPQCPHLRLGGICPGPNARYGPAYLFYFLQAATY